MSKLRLLPWAGAAAVAALVAGGTGTARAGEIFLGDFTTPGSCVTQPGDSGGVCNSPLTFTTGSVTLTAHGFSDTTFSTEKFLTFRSGHTDESGLGENNTAPGMKCDGDPGTGVSTPCEIGNNRSVSITSNTPLIDVVVGSVQSPERFEVFVGTGTTPNTQVGGIFTSACTSSPAPGTGLAATCLINLPAGTWMSVGVVDLDSNTTPLQASDVLLTAVSVPAPSIGHGLPALLAVGGMLFGAGFWGRGKTGLPLDAA